MPFILEDLPYAYDALEPFIDARTMEIHHDKHHLTYCNQLNEAVHETEFNKMPIEEILSRPASALPEAIRNHGGGFANHNLFWQIMTPKNRTRPVGDIAGALDAKFGSADKFKDEFTLQAKKLFGSGWVWLVLNAGELELITTHNQDSPLMEKKIPLLGLDVWEHAYYLKYQNKRPDYISAWWNVVNWPKVAENYSKARKQQ